MSLEEILSIGGIKPYSSEFLIAQVAHRIHVADITRKESDRRQELDTRRQEKRKKNTEYQRLWRQNHPQTEEQRKRQRESQKKYRYDVYHGLRGEKILEKIKEDKRRHDKTPKGIARRKRYKDNRRAFTKSCKQFSKSIEESILFDENSLWNENPDEW